MNQEEFDFADDFSGTATQKIAFSKSGPSVKITRTATAAKMPELVGPGIFALTAVSFEKASLYMAAKTGLKINIPKGFQGRIYSGTPQIQGGAMVLGPQIIHAEDDNEVVLFMGSTTGQAPFLPEPFNKAAKIGNMTFYVGDQVAYLQIVPVTDAVMEEGK